MWVCVDEYDEAQSKYTQSFESCKQASDDEHKPQKKMKTSDWEKRCLIWWNDGFYSVCVWVCVL